MLTLWAMRPVANSMIEGSPTPAATVSSVRRWPISSTSWATSASASDTSVLISSRVVSLPSWSVADAILVPPTSSPMNWPSIYKQRRRGLVDEDEDRAVLRAHARGGRVGVGRVAERARDRLRLVGARDEEVDHAGAVEDGQRERHARHLRLHARERHADDEAAGLLELRLAREQRGDVRVGPHPEQHEVEARVVAEVLAHQRLVGARGRLVPELALDAHDARGLREAREQRARAPSRSWSRGGRAGRSARRRTRPSRRSSPRPARRRSRRRRAASSRR